MRMGIGFFDGRRDGIRGAFFMWIPVVKWCGRGQLDGVNDDGVPGFMGLIRRTRLSQ
ncbi:hypothetical protein [Roseateles sp.]|uniref:hypothetical protein n=1 Tax=Roseateles sp. TaxID=1971397 RepID=UPI003D0AE762